MSALASRLRAASKQVAGEAAPVGPPTGADAIAAIVMPAPAASAPAVDETTADVVAAVRDSLAKSPNFMDLLADVKIKPTSLDPVRGQKCLCVCAVYVVT
jgi:hypothetical protein